MIEYSRDSHESIPSSAVKIVGLGGAGANMLERIALDSLEGAELIALNTDIRTLGACLAKEKVQLGVNLTKGLGTGGDPELGQQAILEAEAEVRKALKGQRIVFLCTGLGGGTGSGAAPIVSRIAREEGAFVVVFATMPFFFEGRRRREQAETALNELAVLSNALVTFDNNRMGELVLAKQGIHEAFAAADTMISESIKAVIRLVIRPGLINVGLDDLMSALRTTRSRCLFGSGMSDGKDRASKALRNALSSPLLDQGSLLKEAQTVLVHLSGGESLTLYEIELLMRSLQKHVPDHAHVLFGAAIDPSMGDNLSITLISALPEDALTGASKDSLSKLSDTAKTVAKLKSEELESPFSHIDKKEDKPAKTDPDDKEELESEPTSEAPSLFEDTQPEKEEIEEKAEEDKDEDRPFAEFTPETKAEAVDETPEEPVEEKEVEAADTEPEQKEEPPKEFEDKSTDTGTAESKYSAPLGPAPKRRPPEKPIWGKDKKPKDFKESDEDDDPFSVSLDDEADDAKPSSSPELKLGSKPPGSQSELSFDSAPRGRFEGENPNVVDGEDLDLPPFLRKKKS
ncbi:MAG: cell division protein FtsZ [Luteolibacter sp.]